MRPITLKLNLSNQSATIVAAAQTIGSAGNLVLASGASAIDASGAARILLFTTTENDSSINALITGLDANGNTISETLALPSTSTAVSVNQYASVSSIYVSGAIASNVTVGTTNTTLSAVSKVIPLDLYSRTGVQIAVEVTGTVNYTVQETFDDVLGSGTSNIVFFSPSALATKTSNITAPLDVGATGARVVINSYTNGATLTARIVTVHSTVG